MKLSRIPAECVNIDSSKTCNELNEKLSHSLVFVHERTHEMENSH